MKKKKFDCVRMKHKIQQQLLKETSSLSVAERNRRLDQALAANPILGPFLQKISRSRSGSSK